MSDGEVWLSKVLSGVKEHSNKGMSDDEFLRSFVKNTGFVVSYLETFLRIYKYGGRKND